MAYPQDFPICSRCGSTNIAPPSWDCGLCQSHAALWRERTITPEDRRDLRTVEQWERDQRKKRMIGDGDA